LGAGIGGLSFACEDYGEILQDLDPNDRKRKDEGSLRLPKKHGQTLGVANDRKRRREHHNEQPKKYESEPDRARQIRYPSRPEKVKELWCQCLKAGPTLL